MARISRQTREIINMVIAVVVVGLIVFYYLVYPLNKVKGLWGRSDVVAEANDPSAFLEAGQMSDTFRLDIDAMTKLACVYVKPQIGEPAQVKGTVVLVHGNRSNRESLATLGKNLVDSGFAIVAYDQRASGRSTGEYHGDGQLEASDLEALLAYVDIRGKVVHPLTVIGYETGADAAIWASREEQRIDRVVAVGPFITTRALADNLVAKDGALWFPFRSTVFWWWYTIRSSYAFPHTEFESIEAAVLPTKVLMPTERLQSAEVAQFDRVSADSLVTVEALAADSAAAQAQIIGAVMRQ